MNTTKKLSEWDRQSIGFVIRDLGEAFSAGNRDDDFIRGVQKAKRGIDEFVNGLIPLPQLSEEECDLARALHTYSRKHMDSIFSCFIHEAINQNFGINVWYEFIKALKPNKYKVKRAYTIAERIRKELSNFESIIMLAILEEWIAHHDMQGAVDYIVKGNTNA